MRETLAPYLRSDGRGGVELCVQFAEGKTPAVIPITQKELFNLLRQSAQFLHME